MSTSSNSSPVTVSVIVPMYNVADVVGEMVASLHAQSLSNAEFILIDDGSTDLTLPTVSALVKEDPRFLVVPQENQGPAAARNHGLRLAQGEFICFVDSD
ncbi:MAG: glycosyltransferase, partial [Propionibacteriaceae bacterium]|nr:glycosyltransferase [Propionibacteriaceae bacterium]